MAEALTQQEITEKQKLVRQKLAKIQLEYDQKKAKQQLKLQFLKRQCPHKGRFMSSHMGENCPHCPNCGCL